MFAAKDIDPFVVSGLLYVCRVDVDIFILLSFSPLSHSP